MKTVLTFFIVTATLPATFTIMFIYKLLQDAEARKHDTGAVR